jgi:hypothetical protein
MLTGRWQTLAEALDRMRGSAAATSFDALVPMPGPDLAARILALLAALQRGRFEDWTGRDLHRGLSRAAGEIATRLGEDFGRLAAVAGESSGEWRFVPVPLFAGGTLGQIRLFFRGPRRGRDRAAPGCEGTRFLVDVELERLGPLQLDGLVLERRFDLIVRTRAAMASSMRRDIAAIFNEARDLGALDGEIDFLATREFVAPPIAGAAMEFRGVTA